MSLFSQRKGYSPLQKATQRETIDEQLRNRLWSLLDLYIWQKWSTEDALGRRAQHSGDVESLVLVIWFQFFKEPTDTIPPFKASGYSAYIRIRDFFFSCNWYEVYDFVEFTVKNVWPDVRARLAAMINKVLEDESAAYRLIESEIVEITDENEIEAVETAFEKTNKQTTAHLSRSLELLSDRSHPDYRNSIKEAISAVEATCQWLAGKKGSTLGDCLQTIGSSHSIHPAMGAAMSKLYGYTSEAGGIRHALTDSAYTPTYSDAKYMLVVCSAFCNFLVTKRAEVGAND